MRITLRRVELFDRAHKSEVAFGDQVAEREAESLEIVRDLHDQAQVRLDKRGAGFIVQGAVFAVDLRRQHFFLFRRDQRDLSDFVHVQLHGVGLRDEALFRRDLGVLLVELRVPGLSGHVLAEVDRGNVLLVLLIRGCLLHLEVGGRHVERDLQHGLLDRAEHGFPARSGRLLFPGGGGRSKDRRRGRRFRSGRDRDLEGGHGGRGKRFCSFFHIHLMYG